MKKVTTIEAGDNNYLSQFLTDLPDNCIFNKVLTGSGGTHVALSNNVNYVIVVPFVNLIKNKMEQHDNILGVYGGIGDEEIKTYLGTPRECNKIMVTYDSLPRLMALINPSEYKILIDESHKLVDSAGFRKKAIKSVLENYTKFKSFVFMSATPVKDKYQLSELSNIDVVNVKWNSILPVSVQYTVLSDKFTQKIASLIVEHIVGARKGNAYIFLNTVQGIVNIIKILKKIGHKDSNLYKIVCANNEDNEKKVKVLGKGFTIGNTTDENTKITFLTATAFEGCDLYDEEGVTYIATDGQRDSTKIDTITLLPQIIGRLRNSKFKNNVNILFTPSPYFSFLSEEEYSKHVLAKLKASKEALVEYNNTKNEIIREAVVKGLECNNFFEYDEDDKVLAVNELEWCAEMHRFESLNVTYYVKRNNEGVPITRTEASKRTINNIEYTYKPKPQDATLTALDLINLDKSNFVSVMKKYIDCTEGTLDEECEKTLILIKNSPYFDYIASAYTILGGARIKALEYRKGAIEKEILITNTITSKSYKISELLNYRVGQFISAVDAKEDITKAYKDLGIEVDIIKGSDLSKWYDVKQTVLKREGINTKGYKIILKKYSKA